MSETKESVVYNPTTKTYEVSNFDEIKQQCADFIKENKLEIEVVDAETRKQVYAKRTVISNKKKEIENVRKSATKAVTDGFIGKFKELETMLGNAYDEMTANINNYDNKLVEQGEKIAKKYKKTLTIKSYDEETLKKIADYANKLKAKGKEIEVSLD